MAKLVPVRPHRRKLVWAVAAGAALAGWCGARLRFDGPQGAQLSADEMDLWQQELTTPAGTPLRLSVFQGRPLVLNFWATWCPPCVAELPLLSAFYTQNAAKGWQVLGLAVDKVDAVNAFLARSALSFPVAVMGASGLSWSRQLGNLVGGLPFTVLLGSQGHILQRKIGPLQPADLQAWLALASV